MINISWLDKVEYRFAILECMLLWMEMYVIQIHLYSVAINSTLYFQL